jgi:hypothetical protein
MTVTLPNTLELHAEAALDYALAGAASPGKSEVSHGQAPDP